MSGSAVQRDESTEQETYRATGTDGAMAYLPGAQLESAALKQLAAERLAAHRSRRAEVAATEAEREALERARGEAQRRQATQGASRVRAAVAARYQQSVSYREYLAAEAERALEQAQAEAEIAARNARAVAEAQMQLLEELDQWRGPDQGDEPAATPRVRALAEQRAADRAELADALTDIVLGARELIAEPPTFGGEDREARNLPAKEAGGTDGRMAPGSCGVANLPASGQESAQRSAGLQVRLHEQLGRGAGTPSIATPGGAPGAGSLSSTLGASGGARAELDGREHLQHTEHWEHPEHWEHLEQLDREIEFRRAPEFEEHSLQSLPIQANIIEFPRQLIAARKARPRLAEGPLREEGAPQPQLRIFEVEPEQISVDPVAGEGSGAPEWQSLLLDAAEPAPRDRPHPELDARLRPHTAPFSRRILALAVDGGCIGISFIAFSTVVAKIAGPLLHGLQLAALGAAVAGTLLVFAILYQVLFFTWADATPGMRCARIALCTFNDANPTRSAMRRRILAVLVAACPLGLGLVWMALDSDRLGWHDRISRMYPRAY